MIVSSLAAVTSRTACVMPLLCIEERDASGAEEGADPDQARLSRDAMELCEYQVSQQLAKGIQKVAVVAGPEAYPSWPAYVTAFMSRGGIIEACASGETQMPFKQALTACAAAASLLLLLLCCPALQCAVLRCNVLCCCCNTLCCAVLCCAVLCCAVLCLCWAWAGLGWPFVTKQQGGGLMSEAKHGFLCCQV